MLMCGDFLSSSFVKLENTVVLNLTTMKEGIRRLNFLIPPNELGRFTGKDFDIVYMNYIFNNDIVFRQFFDIIYSLYIGYDVFILVSKDDWSENLVESLFKLIQQRYGYNGCVISCFDDYLFASNNGDFNFNPYYGVKNLDMDKERYTYLVENERLKTGRDLRSVWNQTE